MRAAAVLSVLLAACPASAWELERLVPAYTLAQARVRVRAVCPGVPPRTGTRAACNNVAANRRAIAAIATLADCDAAVEAKRDAVATLQRQVPSITVVCRVAALDALREQAQAAAGAPILRSQSLTALGVSMSAAMTSISTPGPLMTATLASGLQELLNALAEPDHRRAALNGLGPASHAIQEASDPSFQDGLLDALELPDLSLEDRKAALSVLDAFVRARDEMPAALVEELDRRLLAPVEADPAAFLASGDEDSRLQTIAVLQASTHWREELEPPQTAARDRLNRLLDALLALIPDEPARETERAMLRHFRDVPPPPACGTRERRSDPRCRRRGAARLLGD